MDIVYCFIRQFTIVHYLPLLSCDWTRLRLPDWLCPCHWLRSCYCIYCSCSSLGKLCSSDTPSPTCSPAPVFCPDLEPWPSPLMNFPHIRNLPGPSQKFPE